MSNDQDNRTTRRDRRRDGRTAAQSVEPVTSVQPAQGQLQSDLDPSLQLTPTAGVPSALDVAQAQGQQAVDAAQTAHGAAAGAQDSGSLDPLQCDSEEDDAATQTGEQTTGEGEEQEELPVSAIETPQEETASEPPPTSDVEPVPASFPTTAVGAPASPVEPTTSVTGFDFDTPVCEVHHDIDALIQDSTGLLISEHAAAVDTAFADLDNVCLDLSQRLMDTADTASTTVDAAIATQRANIQSVTNTSTADLGSAHSAVDAAVSSAFGTADVCIDDAASVAATTMQGAVDQASVTIDAAVATGAANLTTHQGSIQQQVAEKIEAAAVRIETEGKALYDALVSERDTVYNAGRVPQDPGGSPSAAHMVELRRLYGVEEAKKVRDRYIPKVKELYELAAANLRANQDMSTLLSGNLHAPAIEDLYPRARDSQHQFEGEVQRRIKASDGQARAARQGLDEAALTDQAVRADQLASQQQEAQQAGQTIDANLDAARSDIDAQTQTMANDIDAQRQQAFDEFSGVVQTIAGTPDGGAVLQSTVDRIQSGLDQQAAMADEAIASDADAALDQVTTQGDMHRQNLADGVQQQVVAVTDSGSQTIDALTCFTDETAAGLGDAANQSAALISQGAAGTLGATTDAVSDTSTDAVTYLATVQANLDAYHTEAMGNLTGLRRSMDTAMQGAISAAGNRAETEVRRSADGVFSAIDGMGTRESDLLGALRGITNGVHGKAVRWQYSASKSGRDMWSDVKDDTTGMLDDSNLWAACKNYMLGNRAAATRHAINYATGWNNFFGADTKLVEDSLRALNAEERTQLLEDPAFPQTRARVAARYQVDYDNWGGLVGAGSYDMDVFNALTDTNRTHEQALVAADAIRLTEAFEGEPWNPFTWGTNTDRAAQILQRTKPEHRALLESEFTAYVDSRVWVGGGNTIESQIRQEADSDPEREYLLALHRGDMAAADAHRLAMASDEGHRWTPWRSEDDKMAVEILDDRNLNNSGDQLAQLEARDRRVGMMNTFEEDYTQEGESTAEYLERVFDGGEGTKDNMRDELMVELLETGEARPEYWMAFATIHMGTEEKYVKRAMTEMAREGPEAWTRTQEMFARQYGINDLEAYLGINENRHRKGIGEYMWDSAITSVMGTGPWGAFGVSRAGDQFVDVVTGEYDLSYMPELEGEDAFEVTELYQNLMADRRRVPDVFRIAELNYEHYRGEEAGALGAAYLGATGHNSGSILDTQIAELRQLYADKSWWNETTGLPNQDADAQSKWHRFNELAGYLDRNSDIYKSQIDSATNTVTGVIAVVGAVVVTVATAGYGAPAAVGVLISLGFAGVTIAVRREMMGDMYGEDQLLADMGRALAESIAGVLAGGVGRFRGLEQFLDDAFAVVDPSLLRRAFVSGLKSVPTGIVNAFTDPQVWESRDPMAALTGAIALHVLQNMAGGFSEEAMGDQLNAEVSRRTRRILQQMANETTQVLTNPSIMQGDNIGWELLKANIRAGGTAAMVQTIRDNAVTYLNSKGTLTEDDWRRVMDSHYDYRNEIMERLDPSHLQSVPAQYRDRVPRAVADRVRYVDNETDSETSTPVDANRPAEVEADANRPADVEADANRPADVETDANRPADVEADATRPPTADAESDTTRSPEADTETTRPRDTDADTDADASRPADADVDAEAARRADASEDVDTTRRAQDAETSNRPDQDSPRPMTDDEIAYQDALLLYQMVSDETSGVLTQGEIDYILSGDTHEERSRRYTEMSTNDVVAGQAAVVPHSDFHGDASTSRPSRPNQDVSDSAVQAMRSRGVQDGHIELNGERIAVRVEVRRAGEDSAIADFQRLEDGSYLIRISDNATDLQIERAIAHELAEIRHLSRGAGDQDLLTPTTDATTDAVISGHDRGRVAELEVLLAQIQRHPEQTMTLMREITALVQHLGLEGEGAEARLRKIAPYLKPDEFNLLTGLIHAPRSTPLDQQAMEAQHAAALQTVNLLSEAELAAALQQSHGLDPQTAAAIARERQQNGPYTSLDNLRQRVPALADLNDTRLIGSLPRRTELHNHMGGIYTVDDIIHLVGSNAGPRATRLEKLAYVHEVVGNSVSKLKDPDHRESVRSIYRQAGNDADEAFYESQLSRILAAGDIPFDHVYKIRVAVFSGQELDPEQMTRLMMQRLAVQGISYAELQGGLGRIDPETMARLSAETGVEVRVLSYISSRDNMSSSGDGDPHAVPDKVRRTIDRVFDPVKGQFVVGVDYAGEEKRFTSSGIDRFVATANYMQSKIPEGQTAIMRIHVGEGYFADATTSEARAQGVADATHNVGLIIEGIERHRASQVSGQGEVTFRLGHVTHVTDAQLQKLASMGVHVEVNLGSNMTTGAVQSHEEHPILRMLYHGVELSLNTDAGGVMRTDLGNEYDDIASILEDYRSGKTTMTIDGESKPYSELSSAEQSRFDIDALERASRNHPRLPR